MCDKCESRSKQIIDAGIKAFDEMQAKVGFDDAEKTLVKVLLQDYIAGINSAINLSHALGIVKEPQDFATNFFACVLAGTNASNEELKRVRKELEEV